MEKSWLFNLTDQNYLETRTEDYKKEQQDMRAYYDARNKMAAAQTETDFLDLTRQFQSISHFMNSDQLARQCSYNAEKSKEAENKRKRTKKAIIIVSSLVLFLIIAGLMLNYLVLPLISYRNGEEYLSSGDFSNAITMFEKAGSFHDSQERILEVHYSAGEAMLASQDFDAAITRFEQAEDYHDAGERILEARYLSGEIFAARGQFEKAIEVFSSLGDYNDSSQQVYLNTSEAVKEANEKKDYDAAYDIIDSYSDSSNRQQLEDIIYEHIIAEMENAAVTGDFDSVFELAGVIDDPIQAESLEAYIEELIEVYDENLYQSAIKLFEQGEYTEMWNMMAEWMGYYEHYTFEPSRLRDYKDAGAYFLYAYVYNRIEEYQEEDIYDYLDVNWVGGIYHGAVIYADFLDMAELLKDKIFTVPRLEGYWSSGEYYFELSYSYDQGYQAKYNIPWFDGSYLNFRDYGRVMQIGDEDNWRDLFAFTLSPDDRSMQIYSYESNRTYRLYKQ